MKKIINILIISIFLLLNNSYAVSIKNLTATNSMNTDSTFALVVYDINKQKFLYNINEKKMLNPASILKVFTFGCAYKILGRDYTFDTSIYVVDNDLYIKLGADTLLTTSDLETLVKNAKKQINIENLKKIYIDDSIFDKTPYPLGWMQDDIWPYQRMISPYIINKNLSEISIKRSSLSSKVDIIQNNEYKMPIINKLTLFNENADNNIKISKLYSENSSIIEFSGNLSKDAELKVPVSNPELNFKINLSKILQKNNIAYDNCILNKKVPQNAKKISVVSHSIKDVSKSILLNSDNIDCETVFRVAAAKYNNFAKTVNFNDCYKMFFETYNFVSQNEIKLADASGVSRYNLISAEIACIMFNELLKIDGFKELLANANEGTLSNRFLFLQNNFKGKTGTLANNSSLIANFKSQNNKDIIVCSMINNSSKRAPLLKDFENRLIALIYKKY